MDISTCVHKEECTTQPALFGEIIPVAFHLTLIEQKQSMSEKDVEVVLARSAFPI